MSKPQDCTDSGAAAWVQFEPTSPKRPNSFPLPPNSNTVVVEVAGHVPGFTQTELATYLARKMHEAVKRLLRGSFPRGSRGPRPHPTGSCGRSRPYVWRWQTGSHRGFSSATNSVTYLSAEVKLYLNDTYQMTMLTEPVVSGGSDALSESAHNVARILFVENKPGVP